MQPQIDGSSKTTAFYPPIAVDQKNRSGRGSRYKSRNFPFQEVPRVASASFVLSAPADGGLFWRSSCPPFLFSSSARPSLVVLANYRMSKQPAFVRLFLHPKGSVEWGMIFSLLRRQSGGKCQECSQSPLSTGITAERFYPDFENKILATRGKLLSSSWLLGPELYFFSILIRAVGMRFSTGPNCVNLSYFRQLVIP